MVKYEYLLRESPVPVHDDVELPGGLKGLYLETKSAKIILLDKYKIVRRAEKACVLAEEIGHHYTTAGDITDQSITAHRKQEHRARVWAHEKLVPLSTIIEAHKAGIRSRYEFAEYLSVTEEFLSEAINRYTERYGVLTRFGKYTISFDPLGVIEFFD